MLFRKTTLLLLLAKYRQMKNTKDTIGDRMAKKKKTGQPRKDPSRIKKQVGIMLTPDSQEFLDEMAEASGVSKSTFVELLIRQAYRRFENSEESFIV